MNNVTGNSEKSELLQEELVNSIIPEQEKESDSEKVLVKMNVEGLGNGCQIPDEVWRPIFGGSLEKLWNEVLDEGDEIAITGSSILKMVYGGYVKDINTGYVSSEYTSDVDCIPLSPAVREKLEKSHYRTTETAFSKKLSVDNREVEYVDMEELRQMHITSLWELGNEISQQPQTARNNYLLSQIVGQLHLVEGQGIENFLSVNSYFKHEALAIKLTKKDGVFEATLLDPMGSLNEWGLFVPRPDIQEGLQESLGEYSGFIFRIPNLASTHHIMMEAFATLENAEFSTKIPLYSAASLSRYIQGACENNIEMMGDPDMYSSYEDYKLWWAVSYRLAHEHDIFHMSEDSKIQKNSEENFSEKTWIKEKFQKNFARAAASNPELAISYMLWHLPLANFISPEVDGEIEEYRKRIPPNNTITEFIRQYQINENNIIDTYNYPAFRALVRLCNISDIFYERKPIEMRTNQASPEDRRVVYYQIENPPENMSEVFALMFVSLNWNEKYQLEKIENVLSNWTVSGILEKSWKKGESPDFDMGVDLKKVTDQMIKIRKHFYPETIELRPA